jgi:CheY-like chemotaxis protein
MRRPSNLSGDVPGPAAAEVEIRQSPRAALGVVLKWRGAYTESTRTDQPRVLLVDDEAGIRQLERRILEKDGYEIVEATGGPEALARIEGGQVFDLLIADLDMPGLGGEEMVRRIRTTRPDLTVLYVTGHINRLLDVRPMLWAGEAFLEKPFTAAGLREAVAMLVYGTLKSSSSGADATK